MERLEMVSILHTKCNQYFNPFQSQFFKLSLYNCLTGYDYWARVYDHNQNSWPPKRDIDNRDLFLPPTERENGNLSSNSLKDAGVTLEQRKLLEGSGYG